MAEVARTPRTVNVCSHCIRSNFSEIGDLKVARHRLYVVSIRSMSKLKSTLSAALGLVLIFAFIQVPLGGCDTTKLAADSTADIMVRAAPGIEMHWDYELIGDSMPAAIVQIEGFLRIVPDNKSMLLTALKTYLGYAYAWLEDEAEAADMADDLETANEKRRQARVMYLRGLDLGFHRLRLDHPGWDKAVKGDNDSFRAWLKKNMKGDDDADVLMWVGQTWGAFIGMASDDMDVVADLPTVKAMLERSFELDDDHLYSLAQMALGIVACQEIGGNMEKSKADFDAVLEKTKRRNLVTQLNMARYYAVQMGDKQLFKDLLNEVLDAGDVLPENRLSNRIARRRAERYINNGDYFFSDWVE